MTYDPEAGTVPYRSNKKKGPAVIQTLGTAGPVSVRSTDLGRRPNSARDGRARLSAHLPNKGEPMVHDYGWYSNRPRGERKKTPTRPTQTVPVPEAESDFKKEARRHGARLINRIALAGVRERVYEVDPLRCPNCSGRLRMIRLIEEPALIARLLRPLGWWHVPARKRAPPPSPAEIPLDYSVADEPVSYDSLPVVHRAPPARPSAALPGPSAGGTGRSTPRKKAHVAQRRARPARWSAPLAARTTLGFRRAPAGHQKFLAREGFFVAFPPRM